jgi:hypothetical protein
MRSIVKVAKKVWNNLKEDKNNSLCPTGVIPIKKV